MGVTGLWTVVQPCARPVKLETLNKKRLAVDASIWIYQFLKAVRDKEGNALRNSHVVGFFRRICKLLYFGIKPVFVFDGGAPVLKRQTIAGRKKRREGRREDAVRTAGKLLAVQMQRIAEEEAAAAKRGRDHRRRDEEEEEVPDNPVYVEERFMTEKEKRQGRQFKKKDAYHLPNLEVSLEQMGAPDDPRIMSREELEEYARQFHQGEDINLYDFSKIDFDSPFFASLPATDRYNILNAARLRSRLRMGYSKEQLDNMFPDRMAFSKFQIERVKERNDLTQRLMNLNGMNGEDAFLGVNTGQRIAGERGREYVLVKDSAVEGGWALGVVGNKDEGQVDKPIDVDQYGRPDVILDKEEVSDDEGGFEDVPIEGLNRLPKLPFLQKGVFDESIRQQIQDRRRAVYEAPSPDALDVDGEDDGLFVANDEATDLHSRAQPKIDGLFESHGDPEDEDLRRAIELSMEGNEDHLFEEIPINADEAPSPPKEREASFMAESDDDEIDFATAVAQTKRSTQKSSMPKLEAPKFVPSHPFDGPLPFESLKLGKPSSRKDSKDATLDEDAGGFEKEPRKPKKKSLPLPPWFSGERLNSAEFIADEIDNTSVEKYRDRVMTPDHQFLENRRSPGVIDVDKLSDTGEVIDLEASPEKEPVANGNAELKQDDSVNEALSMKPSEPIATSIESPKAAPEEEKIFNDERPNEEVSRTVPSPSPEFEDVAIPSEEMLPAAPRSVPSPSPEFENVRIPLQDKAPEAPYTLDTSTVTDREFDSIGLDQQDALVEDEGDLTDPEDADLMRQLAEEAEEHVRFATTLNSAAQTQNVFDYEQELKQLRLQQKKDRRDADEVSQVMISECQQLLTLFGLPYITAPMEAEAQCAELVALGLVDGIVTDDSDIFLFGGTRVYKNMFNQSKYVECYLTSDMEKEYALHRQKLISFAHLLGSDYTEGIPGIGPVTALEILTEFPSLEEFREWWTKVQTGMDMANDAHAAFYKKFRKNASKIFLPPSFPDPRVDVAYLEPEVDSDPSPFQWGVPDLNGLRNFLMATIGWSPERTDEILLPVIRDMNRREQEGTQSNITSFFSGPQGAGAFAPRVRSSGKSRMEKAFGRLRQEAETNRSWHGEEDIVDTPDETTDGSRATGRGPRAKGTKRSTQGQAGDGEEADDITTNKKRKTRRRTKANA